MTVTAPTDRPIVALVGPTGVGKTQIAIELCRRFGGEIVGADSVQIYRELDIGSGKPTREELRGVPHHLIDVLAPDEAIDAARFAQLADAAIAQVAARGAVPFVVGGTGLWLRALLRGLLPLPAADPELRAELQRELGEQGEDALHARLREVDAASAARLHPRDHVRVLRALEVYSATGRALSALQAEHAHGAPRYRALTLLLDVPAAHWQTAIAARVHGMLERGFADEVRGLVARYGPDIKPLRSVGYRQLVLGLRQGASRAQIETQIVRATRIYGRRQRTWFRGEPSVDLRMRSEEALAQPALERIAAHLA